MRKAIWFHINDKVIAVAQGDSELVDVVGWRIDDVVKLIKDKRNQVRLKILPAETGVNGPSKEVTQGIR